MSSQTDSSEAILNENRELRARLAEVEQTLDVIRSGIVVAQAPLVEGGGNNVTLGAEDQYYRILIGAMQQGAIIMTDRGVILYANRSVAAMLKAPLNKVIGSIFFDWIDLKNQSAKDALLHLDVGSSLDFEMLIKPISGPMIPVLLSAGRLTLTDKPLQIWIVVTDLSEIVKRKSDEAAVMKKSLADEAERSMSRTVALAVLQKANYTRSLIEASLDPMVTISSEGKITDLNEATMKATGRTRTELLNTDFSSYFTDAGVARKGYEEVFKKGFVKDYPLAIRHHDGHLTEVLYNASLYRDEKGQVQGVFAAARDITERKHAELIASQLAAIVESSDDAILGLDLEGTITSWNHGAERLFGYTSGEMLGTSTLNLITAEHHALELQILQRIGRGETLESQDTVRVKKNGDRLDVSIKASPIKNALGQIIGVSKVARDITERKLAEKKILDLNKELENRVKERTASLALSEERMRQASIAAGLGIWDWDLRSNRVAWDNLMFSIYGMPQSADGVINYEDWTSHVHPDDLAHAETMLRHVVEVVGRNQREFRIIRESDGATRTIRASDAAIPGEDGKTVRVVGVNLDITESVAMHEEILQLNTILKKRTEDLEASVAELDAFSYSVSHDLRAPLRAIDGFSRIVEEDYAPKLDDEGRRLITVIRDEAQRMGKLIDDLLAFSRLGRQKIEGSAIDMETMVRTVFQELAAEEPRRTIHLDLKTIPPAFGAEPMVRQIWVNLIGNAVKFTGKREVAEIEIGVMPGEQGEHGDEGEQVYFIRDNGAGFDMRYADKLFGVFQRLHSKEEFPGTGIGLALVQRIVHRHGGRVWGEGEVGKGATLYFTLPDPRKQPPNIQ